MLDILAAGRGHQHQLGEKLAAVADHNRADLVRRRDPAVHGQAIGALGPVRTRIPETKYASEPSGDRERR